VPSSWSAKCRERTLRFALPQEIRCSALIYSLFRLAGNSTANPLQRAIGTLSAKFLVFSGYQGIGAVETLSLKPPSTAT
jgi:hypothetical protein